MNGFPWQRDWRNSHQPSRIAQTVKSGIQEKQLTTAFASVGGNTQSKVITVVMENN